MGLFLIVEIKVKVVLNTCAIHCMLNVDKVKSLCAV